MHPSPGSAQLRVVALPVAIAPLAVHWLEQFDAESGFVVHFGVGTAFLRLSERDARRLDRELRDSPPRPGHWVWEHCPEAWLPDPIVSLPAALSLHQSVRRSFDPTGLFVSLKVPGTTKEVKG
jgi:hypothetical protein